MEILLQIGLMVISGALTLMVSWLTYRFKKKEERVEAERKKAILQKEKEGKEILSIKNGILSLLRDRIGQSCRHIQDNGHITQPQLKAITDLYDSYKDLGGNHGVHIIVEKTIKLPIKQ